ncbi:12123_t:CDS:2, partial [Racocetra persica]
MSTHDSHQLSSYNSDSLSWANEDELNESNELNELNTSNIPEDVHNLDAESGSSSPDQLPSSGVTVTNSLDRIREKVGYGLILSEIKLKKKIYCKVIVTDKDGLEKEC